MNFNIFNLFKKNGWEISNYIDALENEYKGKSKVLSIGVKNNLLSAINLKKDKFIVIREFAARKNKNNIQLANKKPLKNDGFFPISHFGMTLVSISKDAGFTHDVILPNNFNYKKIELTNDVIKIHHSKGTTITNFSEIKALWTIKEYSAKAILQIFNSLCNKRIDSKEYKKFTSKYINDKEFGQLILSNDKETYDV